MAIRAVLFDLDGTLWNNMAPVDDWEPIQAMQVAALRPHFDRLNLAIDPDEFVSHFWDDLTAAQNPPSPDHREPLWFPVLQRGLARFGQRCDESDAEPVFEALLSVPLRHVNVCAFEDAARTLTALHTRGFKLGVITNNPKPARVLAREIHDQGLPGVFETIVSSYDLGYRKPHPLAFETALRTLGVGPAEAAHVGDSYDNDIAPALALGMTAIFRRSERPVPAGAPAAHHTIDSLAELVTIFNS